MSMPHTCRCRICDREMTGYLGMQKSPYPTISCSHEPHVHGTTMTPSGHADIGGGVVYHCSHCTYQTTMPAYSAQGE